MISHIAQGSPVTAPVERWWKKVSGVASALSVPPTNLSPHGLRSSAMKKLLRQTRLTRPTVKTGFSLKTPYLQGKMADCTHLDPISHTP
jgi:hypothetical protein